LFVVAVLFYVLFYSINGAQPNSIAFFLFCYSLAGFSVALAFGGVVDLVVHRRFGFDRWAVGKASVSVIAGLALTFFSAPYPPYGVFELSYTGFPLPFAVTSNATASPFTSFNLNALLIDGIFWIALSYPAVWLVGSAITGDLRKAGLLEGVGAAAFLAYGPYPLWKALISTGVFSSLLMALGPFGSLLILFLSPGLLAGALLAVRGHRHLGFTVFSASLLFVSLFERRGSSCTTERGSLNEIARGGFSGSWYSRLNLRLRVSPSDSALRVMIGTRLLDQT
jgi:hypothetical protein